MPIHETPGTLAVNGRSHAAPNPPLHQAILRTIAYADLFDYPLTAVEIHRYLEGISASLAEIDAALANGRFAFNQLNSQDSYFTLPGREEVIATRREREIVSRRLWPKAARYGRFLDRLPFVRMAAVTGSLAMNNAASDADIDYLIVTENGRLWLCRAIIIGLVRLARLDGVELCPNYILAESVLAFPDRNLYVAHEIAQMVPLFGLDMYRRIRQLNAWTAEFLPNAAGPPVGQFAKLPGRLTKSPYKTLAELPLRSPVGRWLEQWEMNRKIRKLHAQETGPGETHFSPTICKGHFDAYNNPTMKAYNQRTHQSPIISHQSSRIKD